MSSRPPRKRENFKPPADWILAKAVLREHEWFLEVPRRGGPKLYPVAEKQSWNANLHAGLEVYVTIIKNVCTIERRATQNKQYVKIT